MMLEQETRVTIQRSDYHVSNYLIDQSVLHFQIDPDRTRVRAVHSVRANPKGNPDGRLTLDGVELDLISISINGRQLDANDYSLDAFSLTIKVVPDQFELTTECFLHPARNTALEGLYQSGEFLLTQCEAEGFRKITWCLDRPDVMSRYRVHISADRDRFPVLLSNGNLLEQGQLDNNRHYAVWDDPFPKPSYLFALVAGDLEHLEDHFTTCDGREVTLRVYAEAENMSSVDHAMVSLKKAMVWDQERFGLVYDLDCYNIVTTNDFNMGAMENKGLNVFNSKYVLARPDTATDQDFMAIEAVIGHEYFHNWTGNRVTCQDWFQLSLKEGLTVFRDQEFSSDLQSRAVMRIENVRLLRAMQFPEDAGPMSHPVRPDSYIEINNFYTLTVYEKGSEVVRMYHTLLGEAGFQRGMQLYFERHAGQAVTCNDFRAAMADANQVDLEQFERWYSQAGTPVVQVQSRYDAEQETFTLEFSQSTPATPGQAEKLPLHIPVRMGLVGSGGEDLPLTHQDGNLIGSDQDVLELTETSQSFTFTNLPEAPVPSLFRGFSAPVSVKYDYSREELAFLMANDSDSFNRWDAAQQLACQVILEQVSAMAEGRDEPIPAVFLDAALAVLTDVSADPALVAMALSLPEEAYLAEQMKPADITGIHLAIERLKRVLARFAREAFEDRYHALTSDQAYSIDQESVGHRALRNVCLGYLACVRDEHGVALARNQYNTADNMTDSLAALKALVHNASPIGETLLQDFYQRWQHDALVMDKWLSLQATSPRKDTLERVRSLMDDAVFSLRNPNKIRALIGAFSRLNPICFHAEDGSGYQFLADQVLAVDRFNPQVAARLVGALNGWRGLDEGRAQLIRTELQRIVADQKLSRDVFEIANKALS
jgi:aminopeptidase N